MNINNISIKYYRGGRDFFVWTLREEGKTIEFLTPDQNGKFTKILSIGYYYFVPIVIPLDEKLDWEFAYQYLEITKDLDIEINGSYE